MEHRFPLPLLKTRGFSLIELLVVIGMMSLLFTLLIGVFNPVEQYNRSIDAKRQSELNQVKTSLDSYFNDTGCYPKYVLFGASWKNGNTVYSQKVPEDPQCGPDPTHCFVYQTDGSDCPQWNVIYASMRSKGTLTSTNKILCPLELMNSTCTPTNYGTTRSGYNYCVVSGSVSCSVIVANPVPTPVTSSTVDLSPTPTPSPAIAPSCNGVDPSNINYKRYKCNGTCQDAGTGNGYYCIRDCEGVCPSN